MVGHVKRGEYLTMLTRRSLLKALALLPFCPQSIKTLAVEPTTYFTPFSNKYALWVDSNYAGPDTEYVNSLSRYLVLEGINLSESIRVVKEDNNA